MTHLWQVFVSLTMQAFMLCSPQTPTVYPGATWPNIFEFLQVCIYTDGLHSVNKILYEIFEKCSEGPI